jgi:hypothetical protein
MHYLDDFLVLSAMNTDECSLAFERSLHICARLGFPVAPHKLEGPAACLTFMWIFIDTVQETLSLPPEKLDRLKALIMDWHSHKFCRKYQLIMNRPAPTCLSCATGWSDLSAAYNRRRQGA